MPSHYFVDYLKIREICQKDIELDRISKGATGRLSDGGQASEYPLYLGLNISFYLGHGLRVEWDLT
jgi:hypothetical protein